MRHASAGASAATAAAAARAGCCAGAGSESLSHRCAVRTLRAGDDINSTCSAWRTANINGYCVFSGTSQATPHIAGMFVRCFSSGACRDTRGAENVPVGIEEWAYYNNYTNREYGYSKDPIRDPTTTRYYGFLSWADAW